MKTNVFFKCLKGVVLLLASLKGWFLGQKNFPCQTSNCGVNMPSEYFLTQVKYAK